jgi:LysM repeat protein
LDKNAYRSRRTSLVAVLLVLLFSSPLIAETYTVRRGDTLYSIAKKFGTTVFALQQANKLKSPRLIHPGQKLTIPSSHSSGISGPITYGRSKVSGLEVTANGKRIAVLPKDAKFIVLGRENGKFNIKLSDGRIGWVSDDEVVLEEGGKPLPGSSRSWSMRSELVSRALAYRGTRYRRGGESSRGFDCSGFVKYIYGLWGVKLPHDSRAMFKFGTPVAKSDLQPGDILFFANTYRRGISHVGLYIGDGKMIHASNRRGGVRVDSINDSYFGRRYVGARRITLP